MERETEATELSHPDKLLPESWLVRSCEQFLEELRECRRIRGRFQQLFLYGHVLDCSQWKEDLYNCRKWRKTGDVQIMEQLIAKEKERYQQRMANHEANNVWQKRTDGPPPNWHAPLPAHLEEKRRKSSLYNFVDPGSSHRDV